MDYYKDFKYVDYVVNCDFTQGYKLYKDCLTRIKEQNEKDYKNKIYQLYLIEVQNGLKIDFETYYKDIVKKSETKQMNSKQLNDENDKLIDKYTKMDLSKFKPVRRLKI